MGVAGTSLQKRRMAYLVVSGVRQQAPLGCRANVERLISAQRLHSES